MRGKKMTMMAKQMRVRGGGRYWHGLSLPCVLYWVVVCWYSATTCRSQQEASTCREGEGKALQCVSWLGYLYQDVPWLHWAWTKAKTTCRVVDECNYAWIGCPWPMWSHWPAEYGLWDVQISSTTSTMVWSSSLLFLWLQIMLVALHYLSNMSCIIGPPIILQTDNGREFSDIATNSKLRRQYCFFQSKMRYDLLAEVVIEIRKLWLEYRMVIRKPTVLSGWILYPWMCSNNSTRWLIECAKVAWQINTQYHHTVKNLPYILTFGQWPCIGISSGPCAHWGDEDRGRVLLQSSSCQISQTIMMISLLTLRWT